MFHLLMNGLPGVTNFRMSHVQLRKAFKHRSDSLTATQVPCSTLDSRFGCLLGNIELRISMKKLSPQYIGPYKIILILLPTFYS